MFFRKIKQHTKDCFKAYPTLEKAIDDTTSNTETEVFEGDLISRGIIKRQLVAADIEKPVPPIDEDPFDEDPFDEDSDD